MTYHMQKVTGFPANRVIGQAGVLDSARMAHFIALELNCAEEDVSPMVLGGHGDTMVPLPRYTTVGGIPITQLMSQDRIDAISARTAGGGERLSSCLSEVQHSMPLDRQRQLWQNPSSTTDGASYLLHVS